jgi:hypothetical protein
MFCATELLILIHVYYNPDHIENVNPSTLEKFSKRLIVAGYMLEDLDNDSGLALTDKGKAFVWMLLATPEPVQTWSDPRIERQK